jgi:hypothetical protein
MTAEIFQFSGMVDDFDTKEEKEILEICAKVGGMAK